MSKIDSRIKKTIETYDTIAQKYFDCTFNLKIMAHHRKLYLEYLSKRTSGGERILDIGCGSGRDSLKFSLEELDCVGMDLSSKLISLAKKNVSGVEFCIGDMLQMPFEDDSFDGLWACASLLHVPHFQKHTALREFKRVSKPNSILYLAVKEGNGEEYEFLDKYDRQARHFSYYTMADLIVLVKQHDFKILRQFKSKGQNNWLNMYAQIKK